MILIFKTFARRLNLRRLRSTLYKLSWSLSQKPKEIVVIWNNSPRERRPLSVVISSTGGRSWSKPRDVSPPDGPVASYPGIAQDRDGNFVAVWQQVLPSGGREIRYGRFNRAWVLGH